MATHEVRPGDCMASIAKQYGFYWEKLWNLPRNEALKAKRKNPNQLLPGDIVFLPAKQRKTISLSTAQSHKLRRRGVPSRFELRLMSHGRSRAELAYRLELDDGTVHQGTTDARGYLSEMVQPDVQQGRLVIEGQGEAETYVIRLGHLDPLDSTSGIQQRLRNLGHRCPITGELDRQTRTAIGEFQARQGLEVTGEADGATLGKLKQAHGS